MKKTLLKTLTMAVSLVSLTALTACSNDDETPIEQPTPSVTPSATIHFKTDVNRAGDDTRSLALSDDGTTLEAEWKAGEKVALIYGSLKFEASVTAVAGGVATIEADLPGDVPDGTSVRLIYPYAATGTAPESDDYLTLKNDLLEDQKGTLDYISQNLDVSTGNGTLRVDGSTASLDGNVTMANAFIIFKFALKDGEGNPLTGVKKFWLTKGIYSTASGADWFLSSSVTNDAGLDEVFMAAPMNGTLSYIQTWLGWVFTAATASQVYETGTLTGNDFKAGTYYRPTLKMNVARKPLSQADDDYRKPIGVKGGVAEIYNSGRAVDIFDADPVAIVVYSGSDADITEGKGHGLAMALKSAAGTWHIIPGLADESQLVDGVDIFPNIADAADKDEACNTDYNGLAKTEYLLAQVPGGSAFANAIADWREAHPISGDVTPWFIPSIGQWIEATGLSDRSTVWCADNIGRSVAYSLDGSMKSATNNKTSLYDSVKDVTYWSSSEYDSENGIHIYFFESTSKSYTWIGYQGKETSGRLRPFFAF